MVIDCISEYKKILNSFKSNIVKDMFLSDSIDKFKITKHRDGNYPAIITISGWRSEDKDNRKDWQDSILELYPDREWFHLEWNSKRFPIFDEKYETKLPNIFDSQEVKKPKFLKLLKHLIYRTNMIANTCDILINNYWHSAVRNSKDSGVFLAKVLNACQKKEFILIGHSLGARVIYNCLKHIDENELNSNVFEVNLLGGAVSSNEKKWLTISLLVKNNIYNYFSDNDLVLKSAYRISMLSILPIGLTKIENKKVINKDSTRVIKGHSKYIENFHFLKNNMIPVEIV